jgi:hypothetical protein
MAINLINEAKPLPVCVTAKNSFHAAQAPERSAAFTPLTRRAVPVTSRIFPSTGQGRTVKRPDRRRAEAALWRAAKAEGRAPAIRRAEWEQPFKIMKTAHPQHGSTQFQSVGRRLGRASRPRHPSPKPEACNWLGERARLGRRGPRPRGPLDTRKPVRCLVRLFAQVFDARARRTAAEAAALPIHSDCLVTAKHALGRAWLAVVAGLCVLNFSPPDSQAAGQATSDGPPSRFIIGISPFLDKSVKDDVYRGIVRLVVEDLPLNSTLSIYDAFELKTITQFSLPDARAFDSPKTRANQFAPAIRDLKLFLAQEHNKPTNSGFEAAIRLPQFLDFLAGTTATNSKPSVLLVGSPLYQDAKEPAFSMVDGYFPADGHLQASREKSVYGFSGDTTVVEPLIVHWIYFGDPWVNDLHKEKVTRFWTLYLERRGAQLAAFTGDLPNALQSFRQPGTTRATQHWTVDTAQKKIEMLRVSRGVTLTDWLTRDTLPASGQTPPSTMIGPMKIGIRWKERIDLDLYATSRPGAETLYFQHVRSPEGYYYKDHRSSPGREYEFIEFESSVDVREVEAFINFYKGACPGGARGEVRIEFDGRIYSHSFFIPADQGNLGRSGRLQEEFWTPIPIQKALKMVPTPIAAGRTD